MKTESPAPLVSDERKPLSYYMNNALWHFDFGQPPDPISGQVVPRSTVESWLDRTKEMESELTKMRAERDELVGALRRLTVRFEDATGERPHTHCGCSYCDAQVTLSKYKTE